MKRRYCAALTAVLAALLCSCSFEAFGYRFSAEPIEDPFVDDDPNVRYYDTADGGRADDADIVYELIRKNGMEYVYGRITDADLKDNICAVLRAMDNLETDVNLPHPIPVDEVRTFVHFVSDYICGFTHVDYYTYSYWGDDSNELAYAIRLSYHKDSEQAHEELDKLNELIDGLVLDAPEDEREKIKFFYDQVTKHCAYDKTFSHVDIGNAYGVFFDGYAVCQGYANAMQLLLSRAGFEAVPVVGKISEYEPHKWNRVKLSDGNWYDIDTTWDDKSAAFGRGGNYKHFLVTAQKLDELSHPKADKAAYFVLPEVLEK